MAITISGTTGITGTGTTTLSIPGVATLGGIAGTGIVRQMKHVTLNSQWTTTANGDQTALSLTFDNPVTVGNQILVMCSGAIVAGTASDNWGAGCDIWLDSQRLSSDYNTNTSPGGGRYLGATDNMSHNGGWGMNFCLVGVGTASSTNPTAALKVNRLESNGNWTWVGVGYTGVYYGKTSTNLVAIEFGV
jgi:hypothetical protein